MVAYEKVITEADEYLNGGQSKTFDRKNSDYQLNQELSSRKSNKKRQMESS